MTREPGQAAVLALLACLAVVPVALPGGVAYMDNAPHLVTLRALASEILPQDHWYTGWTEAAEAGFAAGQINAPLAWTAIASLGALGLPITPLYLLAIALSNVAFALATWRLGRRLFADPEAAFLGAALATVSASELYGIAGAAGGMWPFRLATALLFWGLGRPMRLAGRATWIGTILLMHTYAGVAVLGWSALEVANAAWRRDGRGALHWVGAIAVGLGLAGLYWVPLLDPAIRYAWRDPVRQPLEMLATFLLPADLAKASGLGFSTELLGGGWGLVMVAVTIAGLVDARRRVRVADHSLAIALLRASLAVVVLLTVIIPLTEWEGLGPNPWRYYVLVRVPLLLLAGAGLAGRSWGRPGIGVVAVATVVIGLSLVPHRQEEAKDAAWAELDAVWADTAASGPVGRVYLEETVTKGDARGPFYYSHVPTLYGYVTGAPILGTWYGITTVRSHLWTTSEGPYLLGTRLGKPDFNPDYFYRQFRLFHVDTVITSSAELADWLTADPRYRRISDHGSFASFRIVAPLLPALGIAPESGTLTTIEARRGHLAATLTLTAPEALVRTRQTWHPWWRATVDGQEMPVLLDNGSGMAVVSATRSGHLEITWADRDRVGKALSLASALLLVVLGVRRKA